LQENQFERVGDNQTRKVDVRIIAATNRDLLNEIKHNQFRQDLYFRLNVFPIESAPLRDRMEDVPLLASHLLKRSLQKINKTDIRLTKADMERLMQYDWPGNIRELENVIERAVILANNGRLVFELPTADSVPEAIPKEQIQHERLAIRTYHDLANEERNNIIAALKSTGGKIFGVDGAAELLEIRPTTLASKIKRLRIKPAEFKNELIGSESSYEQH
jgi:transcriptional regulator with GAF, ATPase, and Fis domain